MKTLLICSFLLFTQISFAKKDRVYSFVGADFSGIFSQNEDGSFSGIAVDVIEKASKKLNFKYTLALYPWVRAVEMVKDGRADILIGPYKTIEREELMLFTKNCLYEEQLILVTPKKALIKWDGNLTSVLDKKLGIVRGWAHGKKFEELGPKLRVSYADDTETLLRMLQLERLDIAILHESSFQKNVNSNSVDSNGFKILSPPLSSQKGYFAFSKKNKLEKFIKKFDAQMSLQGFKP